MKKILAVILALCMTVMLCACTVQPDSVAGVAVEQGVMIVARVLEYAVLILSTWVLAKIGKKKGMENFALAFQMLSEITCQTVGELQQTLVESWKKAGGKLTDEEIDMLKSELHIRVQQKLDNPTRDLIVAAGCDLDALIQGIAENYLNRIKG